MHSRKRIRVVFDAHAVTPHRSGIGEYSFFLLRALIDGHLREIELFLYANGSIHPVESREDLTRVTDGIEDGALYRLRHQWALPVLLRRGKYDVFHSPDFIVPLVSGGVALIPTIHDLIPLAIPGRLKHSMKVKLLPAYRSLLRLITRRAARIVTDSRHSARDITSFLSVPDSHIDVIALAPTLPVTEAPLPSCLADRVEAGRYLLYVGRHDPYKGIGLLLHAFAGAFAGARKKIGLEDIKLVIAGKRDSRYGYDDLIAELNLENHVVFTGYVPSDQMSPLYANALALVLPSLYEGFGLPVLDAMKQGVPVLCSNRTSLPEVAGDAALLFDPEDPAAFADALLRVVQNSTFRQELIEQGYARVSLFTWEKTAAAMAETYLKCAASKK